MFLFFRVSLVHTAVALRMSGCVISAFRIFVLRKCTCACYITAFVCAITWTHMDLSCMRFWLEVLCQIQGFKIHQKNRASRVSFVLNKQGMKKRIATLSVTCRPRHSINMGMKMENPSDLRFVDGELRILLFAGWVSSFFARWVSYCSLHLTQSLGLVTDRITFHGWFLWVIQPAFHNLGVWWLVYWAGAPCFMVIGDQHWSTHPESRW